VGQRRQLQRQAEQERQALLQLSQHQLITLEPARGAFVAAPSADEARQGVGDGPTVHGSPRRAMRRCMHHICTPDA